MRPDQRTNTNATRLIYRTQLRYTYRGWFRLCVCVAAIYAEIS